MDIEDIGFDELFGAAVKSEINSREVYEYLADRSTNFVMSDRFKFLADEEQKHEEFIRNLHDDIFEEEMELPDKTPVPLPFIKFGDDVEESKIIEQAMDAEIASRDFYDELAEKAAEEERDDRIVRTLNYLSEMEQNHYDILDSELERIKEFEEFDQYYPAMHQGP